MKIKDKKAFTLAEMLIVLGILGVLMAIGMSILAPEEKARRASISSILRALDTAVYNAYNDDNTLFADAPPANSSVAFCNAIASHANGNNNNRVGYINNTSISCNKSAMPLAANVNDATFTNSRNTYLKFITTSGMHVFISDRIEGDYPFYLIYVDINGTQGPNTLIYTAANGVIPPRYPDIYVFAAINIGRVIPLGILETNPKLLTASANMLSDYIDNNYGSIVPLNSGDKLSYADAKGVAWGFYSSNALVNDSPVITNIEDRKNDYIGATSMLEEPYAYNDYVRSKLGNAVFLQGLNFANERNVTCQNVDASSYYYNGSCGIEIDAYSY